MSARTFPLVSLTLSCISLVLIGCPSGETDEDTTTFTTTDDDVGTDGDTTETSSSTDTTDGADTATDTTDTTTDTTDGSGCTPGDLGCECAMGDVCTMGECVDGMCIEPPCGNGQTDPGEECDDGNDVDEDSCSNACLLPVCGDGVIAGAEACDDGNMVDDDECTNSCALPGCGDAIVQMGEECDDGNMVDDDDCANTCTLPVCGDGLTAGSEECDDGNMTNTDECTTACLLPVCGDSYVQADEECDDGNMVDNDACGNDCVSNSSCGGMQLNPGNGILGCWYTAPAVGQTCTTVCQSHGGFNTQASQHTGNQAGMLFWPNKANRGTWMSVECSSTDNNTNWGANGQAPDANFSHAACYVNCACNM